MAEDTESSSKQNSSGKGLMVVLVGLIIVLLLLVVGGGVWLFTSGVLDEEGDMPMQQEQMKEETKETSTGTFRTQINDLVLNITNAKGREKLMKLSFSLKSSEPNIMGLVEENKAEIIDVVISQISARNSEELLTVGGKALLKEELLEEINKVVNEGIMEDDEFIKDSIKKLYFTTFVIK